MADEAPEAVLVSSHPYAPSSDSWKTMPELAAEIADTVGLDDYRQRGWNKTNHQKFRLEESMQILLAVLEQQATREELLEVADRLLHHTKRSHTRAEVKALLGEVCGFEADPNASGDQRLTREEMLAVWGALHGGDSNE